MTASCRQLYVEQDHFGAVQVSFLPEKRSDALDRRHQVDPDGELALDLAEPALNLMLGQGIQLLGDLATVRAAVVPHVDYLLFEVRQEQDRVTDYLSFAAEVAVVVDAGRCPDCPFPIPYSSDRPLNILEPSPNRLAKVRTIMDCR